MSRSFARQTKRKTKTLLSWIVAVLIVVALVVLVLVGLTYLEQHGGLLVGLLPPGPWAGSLGGVPG